MAKKYLDAEGVKTLWSKTKNLTETLKTQITSGTIIAKKAESATNAETANSATKATQDGNGRIIADTYIPNTLKGVANGVATLDTTGKVPSSQLPSYVDDVLEYTNKSSFPASGEAGKIYIDKDTNKQYRWSGTQYVEISSSLALGETSSTAYPGNKGKQNADNITKLQGYVGNWDYIGQTITDLINDMEGNISNLETQVSDLDSDVIPAIQENITDLQNNKVDKENPNGITKITAKTVVICNANEPDLGTYCQLSTTTGGGINICAPAGFKKETIEGELYEILDESMAITTAELNSILV